MRNILAYNKKSILDNPIARFLDYMLLLFILIVVANNYEVPSWVIVLLPVGSLVVAGIITSLAVKGTVFYSSAKEQQKKNTFTITYFIICFILNLLLAYYIVVVPNMFVRAKWIVSIPIFILIVNIINIPSLFHWLLEDELTLTREQ